MYFFFAGDTDKSIDVFIQDSSSTVGAGLSGLVYNSSGLKAYYRKGATGTVTQLTLATQTVGGAHSDGGFVETDATNMKGVYRLDLSDTIIASEGQAVVYLYGATNMAPVAIRLQVLSPTRGLAGTALPNAAADAAGGLPISDAGGLDLDNRMPAAAAVTNINTVFNTDFAANYNTTLDAWNVNTTHAAGTAWGSGAITAASIAASALNGKGDWNVGKTGYSLLPVTGLGNQTADINGTITTVTNLTNLPNITANWLTASGLAADAVTEIATAVEASILDEGDATALLAAIAAKVEEFLINDGDANATLAAIAAAVRTNLATELSRIDTTISSRLAGASYTAPLDAAGIRTAVGLATANLDTQLGDIPTVAEFTARTLLAGDYATSTNVTTILTAIGVVSAVTARLDTGLESDGSGGYQWTALALENGPAGGGGGDATLANQTAIINHLTDIKGAGFNGATDTLEELAAAVAALPGSQMDLVNVPNPTAVAAIQNGLATSNDIDALNQSASRRILITGVRQYEKPESGSTVYTIEVRTYSGDGAAVNADSTPSLTGTGATSGSLAAAIGSATNPETGVYRWTFTVTSAASIEPVRFDAAATIGGDTFSMSLYGQVLDYVAEHWTTTDRAKLDAIHLKLPSKPYLAGTSNADGDIQLNEATGALTDSHFAANSLDDKGNWSKTGDQMNLTATYDIVVTSATRFGGMIELDGVVYRFTTNALEQAPAGGGGGGSSSLTAQQSHWLYQVYRSILSTPLQVPEDPTYDVLPSLFLGDDYVIGSPRGEFTWPIDPGILDLTGATATLRFSRDTFTLDFSGTIYDPTLESQRVGVPVTGKQLLALKENLEYRFQLIIVTAAGHTYTPVDGFHTPRHRRVS